MPIDKDTFFNAVRDEDDTLANLFDQYELPYSVRKSIFNTAKRLYDDLIDINLEEEEGRLKGGASGNIIQLRAFEKKLSKVEKYGNEIFYELNDYKPQDKIKITEDVVYGIIGKSIKYLKFECGIAHASIPNNRLEISENGLCRTFREL